ncbi:MAG TPA: amidohydrolase [Gammaproteobacteria bacterium]|nr:amidohydrolase [Gammaproteobacteria bacterium]
MLCTAGLPVAQAGDLADDIVADYPRLEALFHHFHANPELSMQEFKTSDRIAAELAAEGYEVTRGIANTGLVGTLRNGDGPVVIVRADMDGLPVQEKSDLPYASRVRQVNLDGVDMPVMHACRHDMHITTLLGVARQLKARKADWRGTVMLLAQPAEENLDGAYSMVADNLYGRVGRPDFALALHVISKYPAGKIAFTEGTMFSGADTVSIKVYGIATHGAAPHLGRDPIVVASQIVLALQTIVTRDIPPLEPAIITVGSFHSGTASNIISDNALLEITVRYNSEAIRDPLLKGIERVAINTARAAGLPEDKLPEVRIAPFRSPVTVNDPSLSRRVRAAMEAKMPATSFTAWKQTDMGAEDFPYLVNVSPPIPSVYFVVGGTPQADLDSGNWAGHHSPLFKIEPEASIKAGVQAMAIAALELLGKP